MGSVISVIREWIHNNYSNTYGHQYISEIQSPGINISESTLDSHRMRIGPSDEKMQFEKVIPGIAIHNFDFQINVQRNKIKDMTYSLPFRSQRLITFHWGLVFETY